jgi:hypothetical protein
MESSRRAPERHAGKTTDGGPSRTLSLLWNHEQDVPPLRRNCGHQGPLPMWVWAPARTEFPGTTTRIWVEALHPRARLRQLSAGNQLATHVCDELGLEDSSMARPFRAAFVSAVGFASHALPPIAALLLAPATWYVVAVVVTALIGLAVPGGWCGRPGRAPVLRAATRDVLAGGFALAPTVTCRHPLGRVTFGLR